MLPSIVIAVFCLISLLVSWHDYGRSFMTGVAMVNVVLTLANVAQAAIYRRGQPRW